MSKKEAKKIKKILKQRSQLRQELRSENVKKRNKKLLKYLRLGKELYLMNDIKRLLLLETKLSDNEIDKKIKEFLDKEKEIYSKL